VLSPLASALRLASVVVCLIVIASFVLFVVNQTSSASTHQQQELNGTTTAQGAQGAATSLKHAKKSSLRTKIDDASKAITSPFDGLSSGWNSQWLVRGVNLLLALVVYGFGLGFLARVIRVRA
jgi:hypothetical protein